MRELAAGSNSEACDAPRIPSFFSPIIRVMLRRFVARPVSLRSLRWLPGTWPLLNMRAIDSTESAATVFLGSGLPSSAAGRQNTHGDRQGEGELLLVSEKVDNRVTPCGS